MKTRPALVFAFALAACSGRGSDIGPRLAPLPSESSKVNVFDDQNRGVVGAEVTIVGTPTRALTGPNGRGELFANPMGRVLLQIDGRDGAAANADLLGLLAVAMTLPGGDIPAVFHLPDVGASATATLNVGTQTGPSGVSNPFTSGGVLTISTGISVGMTNGASTVTVRSTSLAACHLPGDLPTGSAVLMSRGIFIDPPELTFTPGADILALDDLMAPGPVTLYRLDPVTGEWVTIGSGTPGGGVILAAGAITSGGLYAFGVAVTAGSVRGRILDSVGVPVPDVIVSVDGREGRSDGSGIFVVGNVPATLGDGSPRNAMIELFAGGSWLPSVATATVPMNGSAEVDVGDLTFDTFPAGNIRVQQVKRARPEPFRPAKLSSLFGSVAISTTSDALGQVVFEDVPAQWWGFQDAYPKDRFFAYYAQAVGFTDPGRRWLDAFQFFDESAWFTGSRSSRLLATDAVGGGPIFDATIVRGINDGGGFVGETREGGIVFAERSLEGRVTATLHTSRGGNDIIHAFSIDTPNGEHVELPMRQVLRAPLGAFDRHGLVSGTVLGANGSAQHRLRTTRRLELQDWWDQAFRGTPIRSALPIDIDPATTHGAFRAGVDRVGGHLVATELSAGPVTLQKMALATDMVPTEGVVSTLDLSLDHTANVAFAAPGALGSLDPLIGASTLTVDLALEQPSGRVIDVVQGLAGNHAVAGADVTLTLPDLAGSIAGHSWLAMVGGSATGVGGTVTQRCMLRFAGTTATGAVQLLPVPTIVAPAPAATVSSAGFAVQFVLPPNTQYATLELRSQTVNELLLWEVYLPSNKTEFTFNVLPPEADSPLLSGKTYDLTVSVYAAWNGSLLDMSDNAYRDLTTYLQSIGPAERGVDAVSSRSIQVTTL